MQILAGVRPTEGRRRQPPVCMLPRREERKNWFITFVHHGSEGTASIRPGERHGQLLHGCVEAFVEGSRARVEEHFKNLFELSPELYWRAQSGRAGPD